MCFPGKATISNDGATILRLLDVVHPAAKTLVDIARSQDAEVRSVCVCVCVCLCFKMCVKVLCCFCFNYGRTSVEVTKLTPTQNIIIDFHNLSFVPPSGRGRHHLRHSPGRRVPEAAETVRGGGSPPSDHHQSVPHRHQPRRHQDQGDRRLCEERRQAVSAHFHRNNVAATSEIRPYE